MYIPTATLLYYLLYSTTYYKLTEKREYIFPRILAFVPRHYVFKRVGVIFEDNVDFKIHSIRWLNKAKKIAFFPRNTENPNFILFGDIIKSCTLFKKNLSSLRNRL